MAPVSRELFATLLRLVEHPDDPRARRLLRHFDCASITDLLRRLISDNNGDHARLQREIQAVLDEEHER